MTDKKQQAVIADFFKEFHSWSAANVGVWIGAGFCTLIQAMFLMIPYQEMTGDNFGIFVFLFGMWSATLYINPYVSYMEKGKQYRIYDKLRYFPVSLKQLRIFRLRKLCKFCFITFAVFLAGQLLFSYIGYHEITLGNVLYVVIGGLVIPFVMGGATCLMER